MSKIDVEPATRSVKSGIETITDNLVDTVNELKRANSALKKEKEANELLKQELARCKETIRSLERRLSKGDPDVSGLLG
jgi:predicted  nucleic acid-binding Zn-ribbon protein